MYIYTNKVDLLNVYLVDQALLVDLEVVIDQDYHGLLSGLEDQRDQQDQLLRGSPFRRGIQVSQLNQEGHRCLCLPSCRQDQANQVGLLKQFNYF